MGALYKSDPVLEWVGDSAWTLADRRTVNIYRSGSDNQPATNVEYAYLGRLARPDGKGNILTFTSIHPQGSLGAMQLLQTEIATVWGQTEPAPFDEASER
jgi:hypothetical protein